MAETTQEAEAVGEIRDRREQPEPEEMSASQAIGAILVTVRAIDAKIDQIIEVVNEAGEQLTEVMGQGIGSLIGGLLRGDEQPDADDGN